MPFLKIAIEGNCLLVGCVLMRNLTAAFGYLPTSSLANFKFDNEYLKRTEFAMLPKLAYFSLSFENTGTR